MARHFFLFFVLILMISECLFAQISKDSIILLNYSDFDNHISNVIEKNKHGEKSADLRELVYRRINQGLITSPETILKVFENTKKADNKLMVEDLGYIIHPKGFMAYPYLDSIKSMIGYDKVLERRLKYEQLKLTNSVYGRTFPELREEKMAMIKELDSVRFEHQMAFSFLSLDIGKKLFFEKKYVEAEKHFVAVIYHEFFKERSRKRLKKVVPNYEQAGDYLLRIRKNDLGKLKATYFPPAMEKLNKQKERYINELKN